MKPSIFVVEDDPDISRLVRHHLEADGFAVKVFSTGNTVIADSERQRPALFILDIMVPGKDGLELCRQIRQIPALAATPVIFLTAKSGEADRILGLELGADDYIPKPFSPRELVARVKAVLAAFRAAAVASASQDRRNRNRSRRDDPQRRRQPRDHYRHGIPACSTISPATSAAYLPATNCLIRSGETLPTSPRDPWTFTSAAFAKKSSPILKTRATSRRCEAPAIALRLRSDKSDLPEAAGRVHYRDRSGHADFPYVLRTESGWVCWSLLLSRSSYSLPWPRT